MQPFMTFPKGFLWGVSTSAYQVEGNNTNNQWHTWEQEGKTRSGEQSGLACNWWEEAECDFDRAQELGLNALRLSVEWSRIEPRKNHWNQAALDRYREMLKALRRRGIRPVITLHHFTNPIWFEEQGAFLSADCVELFLRFAERVVIALGDLCDYWITFNEPNVYSTLGYLVGEFPPGKQGEIANAVRVLSNIARAHARTYQLIHRLQPQANVGWTDNYIVFQPADPGSRLDRLVATIQHHLFNLSFMRLLRTGSFGFPFNLMSGDLSAARDTCDFVGLNVYNRAHVVFDLSHPALLFGRLFIPDHVPQGDCGKDHPYGEAYPGAIRLAAQEAVKLGKPIYVLENGVPDAQDRIRPWVIVQAVRELYELLQQGIDVRGYFHWSLVDNFEWSEGWGLRFGLFALDPGTQQRTARKSAELYSAIARANGLTEEVYAPACQYF